MKLFPRLLLVLIAACASLAAGSSKDEKTVELFRRAGESGSYFKHAYGYAVFPTIGKAGFVVGGAHGDGHVYAQGRRIGKVSVTQVSAGLQAGGEAYSQIVFFENKHAVDDFTAGQFEFSAGASAIAVTASASASAGTEGAEAAASAGKKDAVTAGGYHDGVAVFTIAKGGLMYTASLAGQKYHFTAGR
jgi:lipid-binding SYLF domain-containing protein